jgi:peptide/nickel transport system ATP-binding protein
MTAAPPLVEIDAVVKVFSGRRLVPWKSQSTTTALRGVSFVIHEGEIVALVGESGSGKTTLARCAARLETPTQGEVRYRGARISELSLRQFRALRAEIQMVFQDPTGALNPRQRARDAIEEPLCLLSDLGKPERQAKVEAIAAEVGLGSRFLRRYRHQMSGGQRQLVSIARALVVEPRFVVLDEPVSSLDASAQGRVLDLLANIQRSRSLTYLFVTHDLEVARALAHRVAIMYRGAIVEIGPTAEIFARPAHPYTRLLLSSSLLPDPAQRAAWRDASGASIGQAIAERQALIAEVASLRALPLNAALTPLGNDHHVLAAYDGQASSLTDITTQVGARTGA